MRYFTELYIDGMGTPNTEILERLLMTTNHLTRVAAMATGNTTPSAAWRTLSILRADGPLRIGEIARASRVTQPGITKIVRELVDNELVYRIADTDDARAWLIAITEKGERALNAWRAELASVLDPMFTDLSADDWRTLERATDLLAAHAGRRAEAAA